MLGMMFMMDVFLFTVGLFEGLQADLADQIYEPGLGLFGFPRTDLDMVKGLRDSILHVHLPDLPDPLDGKGILFITVRKYIPHQVLENILFDEACRSFGYLQGLRIVREVLQGI